MFLFLVTNRSVAGVVCPVAGVILTVVEENHLQVHSDWVIGRLPFYLQNSSDHSLMSGVMHSLAGIMDRKADCVQSVACLFTIHAAV